MSSQVSRTLSTDSYFVVFSLFEVRLDSRVTLGDTILRAFGFVNSIPG